MIPSWYQVGTPGFVAFTHLISSTTFLSAALMSFRIRLKVSPRQSPSSSIRSSIRAEADCPLESDAAMFSSPFLLRDPLDELVDSTGVRLGDEGLRPLVDLVVGEAVAV